MSRAAAAQAASVDCPHPDHQQAVCCHRAAIALQGSAFLTNDQQEWAELTKMVFKLKPSEKAQRPKSKLRAICFWIANNQSFEMFVLLVILMNMGVLASSTYDQSHQHIRLTEQVRTRHRTRATGQLCCWSRIVRNVMGKQVAVNVFYYHKLLLST